MYEIYEKLAATDAQTADDELPLDHLQREKSRFRSHSRKGVETHVLLERGPALMPGDLLRSRCGHVIAVTGQAEDLTQASCEDWSLFSKACYHLGNRHVRLQIGDRWLRMTPDHVLEAMLSGMGLQISRINAVFEPEAGAYDSGRQHHHH